MGLLQILPGRKTKELQKKVEALEFLLKSAYPQPSGALSYEKTVAADGTISYMYGFSIPSYSQDTVTLRGQMTSYDLCSPISGIISRKARALNNGIWTLKDENEDEAKGGYYNYINSLLKKPNILQTRRQFETQLYTYLQLFGECFIFGLTPTGATPSRTDKIKALWVIPNWMIQPEYTGKQYQQTEQKGILTGYRLNSGAENAGVLIDPSLVLHIKDININTGLGYNNNLLQGRSRLVSLSSEVSNIIAAYEARGSLISNRGSVGMISPEVSDMVTPPYTPKEKEALYAEYKKMFGITGERNGVMIMNKASRWQSTIAPTKELMLFEEVQDDIRSMAFAYGMPEPLLGFPLGSTYNNMTEAKRDLYQDAIIPESVDISECLTNWDALGIQKEGLHICIDFMHLEILQRSQKEKADAMRSEVTALNIAYQSGVITREELRSYLAEQFGIDPVNINGTTFYTGQPSAININENGK
jgi:hypothetical protein